MPIGPTGTLARYLPQFNSAALTGGAAPRAAAPSALRFIAPTFGEIGSGIGSAGRGIAAGARAAAPLAGRAALGAISRAGPIGAVFGASNIYNDLTAPNSGLAKHASKLGDRIANEFKEGDVLGTIGHTLGAGAELFTRGVGTAVGLHSRDPRDIPIEDRPTVSEAQALQIASGKPVSQGGAKFEVDKKLSSALKPFGIVSPGRKNSKTGAKGNDKVPADEMSQLIAAMTPQELGIIMKHFKKPVQKPRSAKDVAIGDFRNIALKSLQGVLNNPKATDAEKQTALASFQNQMKQIFAPNALNLLPPQ